VVLEEGIGSLTEVVEPETWEEMEDQSGSILGGNIWRPGKIREQNVVLSSSVEISIRVLSDWRYWKRG
jgi:hypothetical protein